MIMGAPQGLKSKTFVVVKDTAEAVPLRVIAAIYMSRFQRFVLY